MVHANLDGTLKDGAVDDSAVLADNVVTNAKLADNAVTTAEITDGVITNAKLSTSAGELGAAWQSWTPTVSASGGSPTIGNGTMTAKYIKIGKTVSYRIDITCGSTTNFGTGGLTLTLPLTAASSTSLSPIGVAYMRDDSTTSKLGGVVTLASTTTLQIFANSSISAVPAVFSTSPWTWATNDTLQLSGTYEAA